MGSLGFYFPPHLSSPSVLSLRMETEMIPKNLVSSNNFLNDLNQLETQDIFIDILHQESLKTY